MDPSDPMGDSSPTHPRRPANPGDGHFAGQVAVRFWGTRGSTPAPGPETVRYGGNTSCVEVMAGGDRIVLDAGTGIRLLGKGLAADSGPKTVSIFLTHFHWDHIQGLPFFAPVYDQDSRIHIFGPQQGDKGVKELLGCQLGYPYFPIPLEDLPAAFTLSEMEAGPLEQGELRVRAMRVRHSSFTLGYRVEAFGRSVVYIPDNELEGGPHDTPDGWYEEFDQFVRGADLLLHDTMFTEDERYTYEGWGHSTFEQTIRLALENDVKRLYFFHHAPGRSDSEMDELLMRYRERLSDGDSPLQIFVAAEGDEILL